MTELFVTKAIVKLPRKTNRMSTLVVDTNSNFIVTDKLYFEGLSNVTENEIMDLVRSCDPIKVFWIDSTLGYIQFINREMADRAYTLLNGVTSRTGNIRLQLKINPPLGDCPEPEAQAGILHIKNLPLHFNNISLYELFRPFGPMTLCKILVEQGSTFKGTALVQYFYSEHAHHAEMNTNNKPVQDNIITVFPFVSNTKKKTSVIEPTTEDFMSQNRYSAPSTPTSPPIRSDGSSMVDYTNLYIKNLDLNVKSADLFNNFRKFGRIISARVMKNAQTKQSKGFGFVSFSKADEAQKAKQDMNGEYILSKPVIVAFHEPKKPRELGQSPTESTTTTYQRTNSPPYQQKTTSPPMPTTIYTDNRPRDFIDRYHHQKYNPSQTDYAVSPTHTKSYYQPMERNNSYQRQIISPLKQQDHFTPLKRNLSGNTQPSLTALASGAFINTTPFNPLMIRPTFRRRGSVESVASIMTETSSQTRRHTITKAVLTVEKSDDRHIHDIVDMLLTLKKKDLATCLFNKAFLKLKIKQAKDALDIFQEQQQQQQEQVVPIQKCTPPRPSRAIPIVAPQQKNDDIDTFLSSLEGLTLHKKKQALGDRLFPLVKSTGVKQAPRITIRLLDTIPLNELAYSMYDKDKLKNQVDQVVTTLSTSS